MIPNSRRVIGIVCLLLGSERQLERQLYLARREERRDGAKSAVGTVGVRILVIDRVESVESLTPEVQVGGVVPQRE